MYSVTVAIEFRSEVREGSKRTQSRVDEREHKTREKIEIELFLFIVQSSLGRSGRRDPL